MLRVQSVKLQVSWLRLQEETLFCVGVCVNSLQKIGSVF